MRSRTLYRWGCVVAAVTVATSAAALPRIDVGKVRKARETLKEVKRLLPISTQEEIAIGKRVAGRLQATYGVYKNPEVEQYVALVGTGVSWRSTRRDVEYNFSILDTEEVNAYAAPGGFILISRGLLGRMRNEAELAAILGHEIWHVDARHEMKRVQQAQVAGTLVSKALSAMTGEELDQVADLCLDVLQKGRSKDVELQTDVEGARLASEVGYAPHALIALLTRLGDVSSENALKRLMSTHPGTSERIGVLQKKYGRDSSGSLVENRFTVQTEALHKS